MVASNGNLITGGSSYTYRINSLGTPTGVRSLAATSGENQVALSWTAPADNGGASITDYTVEYQVTGAGSWSTFADGTSTATTATVTGLATDTAYNFRVAAVNATGTGTTATVSATTWDVTQSRIATAEYPIGIAEDSAGNIYIGDSVDQVAADEGLTVVPANTGTLFGQSVSAGVEHTLVTQASLGSGVSIQGVAVHGGNLFFTTGAGNLYVLPAASGTVFGQSVTANTVHLLATNDGFSGGIDFDSAGNLFAADEATSKIIAMPAVSGTLFGVSVTANTVATISSTAGYWWWDVAVDASDNLLITSGWSNNGVYILPKTTGTAYGQSVTANTLAVISAYTADVASGTQKPAGIDVTSSGVIYVAYWSNIVSVLSPTTQTLFGQSVTASTATRLTATSGYTNQGVMVASNGNLITGGSSYTYRINNTGKPTGVQSLAATPGETSAALTWVAPTDNGGQTITDYSVQYQTGGGSWTTFADGTSTATTATVTGLASSTSYTFRVAAVTVHGAGTYATVSATTSAASGGGGGGGGGSGGAESTTTPAVVPTPAPSATPAPTPEPRPALDGPPPADPANANLRPGQVRVLVGGERTTVKQSSNPSAGTVTLKGRGWSGTFGEKSGGNAVPLGESGVLDLTAGDRLSVSMKGYRAGSSAGVAILSAPVQVGSMTVSASGTLSGTFAVPASVPAGRHTLQVNGYTASGELRSVALGITVSAPAKKPGKKPTGKPADSVSVPTVITAGENEPVPQTVTGSGPRGTIVFTGSAISLTAADEAELSRIIGAVPAGSRVAAEVISTTFGASTDAEALAQARLRPVVHQLNSGSLVIANLTMETKVQGGSPARGEVAVSLRVLD
jgi:titin